MGETERGLIIVFVLISCLFVFLQHLIALLDGEPHVTWNERCRFALVIFSVVRIPRVPSSNSISTSGSKSSMDIDVDSSEDNSLNPDQVPWTFVHEVEEMCLLSFL